jgi:hypothetical protein
LSFPLGVSLCAGVLLTLALSRPASALPADATRTGKRCDTCHVTMSSKYLNIVGYYYKRKHTLAGAPLEQLQRERKLQGPGDTYKPRYVPGKNSTPRTTR